MESEANEKKSQVKDQDGGGEVLKGEEVINISYVHRDLCITLALLRDNTNILSLNMYRSQSSKELCVRNLQFSLSVINSKHNFVCVPVVTGSFNFTNNKYSHNTVDTLRNKTTIVETKHENTVFSSKDM